VNEREEHAENEDDVEDRVAIPNLVGEQDQRQDEQDGQVFEVADGVNEEHDRGGSGEGDDRRAKAMIARVGPQRLAHGKAESHTNCQQHEERNQGEGVVPKHVIPTDLPRNLAHEATPHETLAVVEREMGGRPGIGHPKSLQEGDESYGDGYGSKRPIELPSVSQPRVAHRYLSQRVPWPGSIRPPN
jgi:hypothetical protein